MLLGTRLLLNVLVRLYMISGATIKDRLLTQRGCLGAPSRTALSEVPLHRQPEASSNLNGGRDALVEFTFESFWHAFLPTHFLRSRGRPEKVTGFSGATLASV